MANSSESKIADTNEWAQLIEDAITKDFISYHDYNEFQNLQHIGSGVFGKVYRATWKSQDTIVALKSFEFNNYVMKEILNEVQLLRKINFHKNIIQLFGITKRKNSEYLFILEYANGGTLRDYLENNFYKLDWNIKLQFAIQIADAVSCLHKNDIIHCDLNSHNILVHQSIIKLADFGLSHRIAEVSSNNNDIFGTLPCIDPQAFVVDNYKASKKSDVYSVGVLLWEISSGQKPFKSYGMPYPRLILEILNTPISGTPIDYINIYTECWQNNPDNRPDIQQVVSDLKLINLVTNEIKIYENTVSNIENNIPINNDNSIKDNSSSSYINHSLQTKYNKLIEKYYDGMQIDENLSITNIYLDENEIIVNELLLLYEDAIKKGIYKNDYIQLIKQQIILKNKSENEIFHYLLNLLNNKSKQNTLILLADFYRFEIGTVKNEVKAFKLYEEAAEKGHINAIDQLGYCYQKGIGTEKNEVKAFKLYKEAAEKGHINAICKLGFYYLNGMGTEKSVIKAFEKYKEAAEKSHICAIYNVGVCYQIGIVTVKNEVKAFELYKDAAEKGQIDAIFLLGYSTEKGLINAIYRLGECYYYGIGTEKNEIKAFEKYNEAAEKGHICAIYNVGICCQIGIGTVKNKFKAFEKYKEAAEKGYIEAAEKGQIDAIHNLEYCYEKGIGIEKNEIRAFELYKASKLYKIAAKIGEAYQSGIYCENCYMLYANITYKWCKPCQINHLKNNFTNWTSGNKEIDSFIQKIQLEINNYNDIILEWIPYNQFTDKYSKCNFLKIWKNGPLYYSHNKRIFLRKSNKGVVIKHIYNSHNMTNKFLHKVKTYLTSTDFDCKIYGISQDLETNDYIIVFKEEYYHGYCVKCDKKYTSNESNWCKQCQIDYFKNNFMNWTSGNEKFDDLIQKMQLQVNNHNGIIIEWIPFDQFKNIKEIGEVNFARIYSAVWKDGPLNYNYNKMELERIPDRNVSLKYLQITSANECLIKVKTYLTIIDFNYKIYGISQNPGTRNYIIVFKNGYCVKCGEKYTKEKEKYKWCKSFQINCLKNNFTNWTSENKKIDDFIHEVQLQINAYNDVIFEWVPYNQFENIKKIGKGNFTITVFSAIWKNGPLNYNCSKMELRKIPNRNVSLKHLQNTNINEFLTKVKTYLTNTDNCKMYGISQHPDTKNFILVLQDKYYIEYNKNYCERCNDIYTNIKYKWCNPCQMDNLKLNFSENKIINDLILEMQLKINSPFDRVFEWVPCNQFNYIKEIGKDDYDIVYSAIWKDGPLYYNGKKWTRKSNTKVALKCLYL
ncbi:unnamed protein product [Rhizophagus irregularis]|nr:unnamed protein product [Rhizophagus irregularis]